MDCRCVPFPEGIDRYSTGFADFFADAVSDFCRSPGRIAVWATTAFEQSHVRHITIPHVSRGRVGEAVYWAFSREVPIREKEAIFDFELEGEIVETGVRKNTVTAYTVKREEVGRLQSLFESSGYPLTGVAVSFFAFRNLFRARWIPTEGEPVVFLYVGREHSRITILSSGNVVLSRSVKAGVNTLAQCIRQEHSGAISMAQAHDMLLAIREQDIQASSAPDAGENSFKMTLPALTRLIRQIERTLQSHFAKLGQERVRRVYVAGEIARCPAIVDYMGNQMQVVPNLIDPFAPECVHGGVEVPEEPAERAALAAAVGLALSDNSRTPNLLYTYRDKEKRQRAGRLGKTMLGIAAATALVGLGVFFWQSSTARNLRRHNAELEAELAGFVPRMDIPGLTASMVAVGEKQKRIAGQARKHMGTAVVRELLSVTPKHIRLANLKAELGPLSRKKAEISGKKGAKRKPPPIVRRVVLNGMVTGQRELLESFLAEYVVRLEGTRVFDRVGVTKTSVEAYEGKPTLAFVLHANIVPLPADVEAEKPEEEAQP